MKVKLVVQNSDHSDHHRGNILTVTMWINNE